MQSAVEYADQTFGSLAEQYEIYATADSLTAVAERMSASRIWLRLDEKVWPTMFHGATVTEREVEHLRRIEAIVRLGRVQRIERERLQLERGEVSMHPQTLYIDCTASALAHNVHDATPVFEPGKIALQMVRLFQPTFSAALIGHIESSVRDEAEKAALVVPTPMTDTLEDWLTSQMATLRNQISVSRVPSIATWLATCRLNAFAGQVASLRPDDHPRWQLVDRLRKNFGPALKNLHRLAAAG